MEIPWLHAAIQLDMVRLCLVRINCHSTSSLVASTSCNLSHLRSLGHSTPVIFDLSSLHATRTCNIGNPSCSCLICYMRELTILISNTCTCMGFRNEHCSFSSRPCESGGTDLDRKSTVRRRFHCASRRRRIFCQTFARREKKNNTRPPAR